MLLEELVESFIHSRRTGTAGAKGVARPRTIQEYKENLDLFLDFLRARGRVSYEEVTRADIRAYIEHTNTKQDWSLATKLTRLRPLVTLFRFIERDEECKELGLKSWEKVVPPLPRNPRREFIPSIDKLKQIRGLWRTDTLLGFRNHVIYSLMLGAGLRVGEVCWLKTKDHLQLENNALIVPTEGKTGTRIVPLDAGLVKLLKMWLKKRDLLHGATQSPWLFIARGGRQCTPNQIALVFRRAQPDRVNRVTPHTLRHSFGTYYLHNGGNMERLRLILGHTTYDTTKQYLHLAETGSEKAKEELERVSPLAMLNKK